MSAGERTVGSNGPEGSQATPKEKITIATVMANPYYCTFFRAYLVHQKCEQQLDFLVAVHSFKAMALKQKDGSALLEFGMDVFDAFLAASCRTPIGATKETSKAIHSQLSAKTTPPALFDEAAADISKKIQSLLVQFVESKEFHHMESSYLSTLKRQAQRSRKSNRKYTDGDPMSLDECLEVELYAQALRQYLSKERLELNLDFLLATKAYKSQAWSKHPGSMGSLDLANSIFEEYLNQASFKAVDISEEIVEQIKSQLDRQHTLPELFEPAVESTKKTIKPFFDRFLKSSEYAAAKDNNHILQKELQEARKSFEDSLPLDKILANAYYRSAFRVYLTKKECDHKLEFIEAIHDLKRDAKSSGEVKRETAQNLYDDFLQPASSDFVQVDEVSCEEVARGVAKTRVHYKLFDAAYQQVYDWIEKEIHPKFVATEDYRHMIESYKKAYDQVAEAQTKLVLKVSLEDVLQNVHYHSAFRQYLSHTSPGNEKLIAFLLMVRRFETWSRHADPAKVQEAGKDVVMRNLSSRDEVTLPVNRETKKEIIDKLNKGTADPNLFTQAFKEVFNVLQSEHFPAFLETSAYQDMINQYAAERAKASIVEIKKRMSLHSLMKNPLYVIIFNKFAKEENIQDDNVDFLASVQEYKVAFNSKDQHVIRSLGKEIFDRYIATDSPNAVNVNGLERELMAKRISQGIWSRDLFQRAYAMVYRIVEYGSYKRFLESSSFEQMVNEHAEAHAAAAVTVSQEDSEKTAAKTKDQGKSGFAAILANAKCRPYFKAFVQRQDAVLISQYRFWEKVTKFYQSATKGKDHQETSRMAWEMWDDHLGKQAKHNIDAPFEITDAIREKLDRGECGPNLFTQCLKHVLNNMHQKLYLSFLDSSDYRRFKSNRRSQHLQLPQAQAAIKGEEPDQHVPSLEEALEKEQWRKPLRAIMKKEGCHENLEFLQTVRTYRQIFSEPKSATVRQKKEKTAKTICDTFLQTTGRSCLNIDNDTKQTILRDFEDWGATKLLFERGYQIVFSFVKKGVFQSFLKSQEYKDAVAAMGIRSSKDLGMGSPLRKSPRVSMDRLVVTLTPTSSRLSARKHSNSTRASNENRPTIEEILASTPHRGYLLSYIKQQSLNEENVLFLEGVYKYRQMISTGSSDKKQLTEYARNLFKRFLVSTSRQAINCEGRIRDDINRVITIQEQSNGVMQPSPKLFDSAANATTAMIRDRVLLRFLNSDIFKESPPILSFARMLDDAKHLKALKAYTKRKRSDHYLEFLTECRKYRENPTAKAAEELIGQFICARDSAQSLKLDQEIRRNILDAKSDPKENLFDPAREACLARIKENIFPFFLSSEEYCNLYPAPKDTKPSQVLDNTQSPADFLAKAAAGQVFRKHCRHGSPHPRIVTITNTGSLSICWQQPGKARKEQLALDLSARLVLGKETKVFRRDASATADKHVCFSIVTSQRTLDLEAPTMAIAEMWTEGIKNVIQTVPRGKK